MSNLHDRAVWVLKGYKKRILKELIIATEKNDSTQDIICLRKCIAELYKAWGFYVTEKTLYNCFKKTGFSKLESNADYEEEEDMALADLKEKGKLIKEGGNVEEVVTLSDFLEVDDNLPIAQYPTDSDILRVF